MIFPVTASLLHCQYRLRATEIIYYIKSSHFLDVLWPTCMCALLIQTSIQNKLLQYKAEACKTSVHSYSLARKCKSFIYAVLWCNLSYLSCLVLRAARFFNNIFRSCLPQQDPTYPFSTLCCLRIFAKAFRFLRLFVISSFCVLSSMRSWASA